MAEWFYNLFAILCLWSTSFPEPFSICHCPSNDKKGNGPGNEVEFVVLLLTHSKFTKQRNERISLKAKTDREGFFTRICSAY